jgi:hypothetical protein
MAFPQIRDYTLQGTLRPNANLTVALGTNPRTHEAGDLLVCVARHGTINGSSVASVGEPWQILPGTNNIVFWRVATSNDHGPVEVTTTTSRSFEFAYFVFSGVDIDAPSFLEVAALNPGTVASPGSDASPALTASWGSADNYFMGIWTATDRFDSGSSTRQTQAVLPNHSWLTARGSTGGSATAFSQIIVAGQELAGAGVPAADWTIPASTVKRINVWNLALAIRPLGAGGGPSRRRSGLILTPF